MKLFTCEALFTQKTLWFLMQVCLGSANMSTMANTQKATGLFGTTSCDLTHLSQILLYYYRHYSVHISLEVYRDTTEHSHVCI